MNSSEDAVPPGVVTETSAAPAAPGGAAHVMVVTLTTTTLVQGLPPIRTVEPETKFVPVIVTAVPPFAGPIPGAISIAVGGSR